MRSLRSHADRLRLDYSHFRGQRRWTDDQLRDAVESARGWTDVLERLGLRGASDLVAVRGHAARLELGVSHLDPVVEAPEPRALRPDLRNMSRAVSLLAAAWYAMSGHDVSWPLEPARFDLLVSGGDGVRRVQVKTTTARAGRSWKVYLSSSAHQRRTYDPDEVDDFFIIDGSLDHYLIPVTAVGGLHAIHLDAYERYRLAPLS